MERGRWVVEGVGTFPPSSPQHLTARTAGACFPVSVCFFPAACETTFPPPAPRPYPYRHPRLPPLHPLSLHALRSSG